MKHLSRLIDGLVRIASTWKDLEYGPRVNAIERTMESPNRFTYEAITFAINQQMSLLSKSALQNWAGERRSKSKSTVGVLNAGNLPLVGFQDFLAVILAGHTYLGSTSSKSPYLLPAIVSEVIAEVPGVEASFETAEGLFDKATTIIATGSDETKAWVELRCDQSNIARKRRLLRGHGYSIAVLDGRESEEDYDALAEDCLLHESLGCRNVGLIWAPRNSSPDDLLSSFAHFRGVFPAHPETPGSLQMQQAFLEALDQPHAYGDGLEFLLSKGEPSVQSPGHIRWVEYDSLDEVRSWLQENHEQIQLVVAPKTVAKMLGSGLTYLEPGNAQRPSLTWRPDNFDTMAFLKQI